MLDFNKPIQTRDGCKVEIVLTNARGRWPVKGYIGTSDGLFSWRSDGNWGGSTEGNNLVNVPKKKYVNVYICNDIAKVGDTYETIEAAKAAAGFAITWRYLSTVEFEV